MSKLSEIRKKIRIANDAAYERLKAENAALRGQAEVAVGFLYRYAFAPNNDPWCPPGCEPIGKCTVKNKFIKCPDRKQAWREAIEREAKRIEEKARSQSHPE